MKHNKQKGAHVSLFYAENWINNEWIEITFEYSSQYIQYNIRKPGLKSYIFPSTVQRREYKPNTLTATENRQ